MGRVTAYAKSTVDLAIGAARASTVSYVQGMTINDVLQVGRVYSTATVTSKPDGPVIRTSDLSMADTRIAGQRVTIAPQGVIAVGNTVGLLSSDRVTDTLKRAGVSARYLAEDEEQGERCLGWHRGCRRGKARPRGSNQTLGVTYVFE